MSGRVCFVRFVNFAKCQKVPALTVRIRNVTQRQTRRIKLVIPMCPRCCCLRQHGYKDPILESEIDKGGWHRWQISSRAEKTCAFIRVYH